MKIIDLLNKIANGEEVPKYIRYRDISKHKYNNMMVCKENIIYQLDQCVINLNDEVEILEEEPRNIEVCGSWFTKSEYDKLFLEEEKKIPEKIEYEVSDENGEFSINGFTFDFEQKMQIIDTINQIIDCIKSKGE